VIHPSLNAGGGSERVCLTIIESLKEKGHNVTLGTFEKTNWEKVEKHFGRVVKPDAEVARSRVFGMSAYGELLNFHLLLSSIPKDYEVAIVSCTSPWFYCPATKKTIIYMIPPVGYQNGLKRIYLTPYIFIQGKFLEKAQKRVILTNSLFSSKVIEDVYSLKSKVLYPPVDLEAFHSSDKEELVVSVGRFNSYKRFEVLLRAFANVDEGKCVILGSIYKSTSGDSLRYLRKLRRLVNDLKLNDRVELLVNSPFSILKHTLSKAKLYVHCALFEHFGISVVEGMASGCVPIVHRSGGPYEDIIDHDRYGFSFEDANELADKITLLLKNDDLYTKYSGEAIKRSEFFSRENFKKRILNIVESKSN